MKARPFKHLWLALLLASLPVMTVADGSGKLQDSALSLSYTSEPYVMSNRVIYNTGVPACEAGTSLCDVYTLTVDLSDAIRSDPANSSAFADITLDSTGDYDLYIYDSAGVLVAASDNSGAEYITLGLDELPNGAYELWLVPYTAVSDSAVLGIAVTGIGSNGKNTLNAVFGGAQAPWCLLPLALLALVRRRV